MGTTQQHPTTNVADREPGFVIKAPDGLGYFVRSRSQRGVWWHVVGNDCTCPHGEARQSRPPTARVCWHIRQTFAYEAALTEPRPVAQPNISALVD